MRKKKEERKSIIKEIKVGKSVVAKKRLIQPKKVEEFQEILNENLAMYDANIDESFQDSAERVLKAWREFLPGEKPKVKWFPIDFKRKDNKSMTLAVNRIHFSALCAHHLFPFSGFISVKLRYSNNIVLGLSKINRLIRYYSHRITVQEKIADDIVKAFEDLGVDCEIEMEAEHGCVGCRGIEDWESKTKIEIK